MAGRRLRKGQYQATPGKYYGTPKEVWDFRTRASARAVPAVAADFLFANRDLFELERDLSNLQLRRVIRSLGAEHAIFSQFHGGLRVHRGYVTVHMDRSRRVYLCKNRAVPARLLPAAFDARITRDDAVRAARETLPQRHRIAQTREIEKLWFPYLDRLTPAWKVRLTRHMPREEWIVYVNARTGGLLSKYDNLAEGKVTHGQVFDPSPVIALGDYAPLLTRKLRVRRPPASAYREVELLGLDRGGYLSGEKVTTAPTARRVRRRNGKFMLRADQPGFEEVMVYYHVDAALRYLEQLGYKGTRAVFRDPVRANVNGTRDDNSWYSPWDRMLTFGTGDVDDAEDAETILHELGHAIQDAICPDFGQSREAAAMGEGFGDYFAASFFAARKPERYRTSVMSWDGLHAGLSAQLDPPCLRRVDLPLTYRDFHERGDEHDNGQIWSATLWEIRTALGRKLADRIILESHFQLDGFTTFARAARAIIDADRNLYAGKHEDEIAGVFRRRKISLR
jgi:Zn-dependent metalloprotease